MSYLEKLKNKKQASHELPKLPKGENVPTLCTAKTAKSPFDSKDSTHGRDISENEKNLIPPPELGPRQKVQQRYETLWAQAWNLTDYVDGDSAPYADRVARLPELMAIRDRLAEMELSGAPPTGGTIEPSKQATYSAVLKEKEASPDTLCPARCKQTGKCYGKAYFIGKPGKGQDCIEPCPYTK